jgi:hypothetical protein
MKQAEQGGAPNAHPRHASCLVADAPGTSRGTGSRESPWTFGNNMKHTYIALFLVLATVLELKADQIVREGVVSTSLVRVIANPERYTGKRILLKGYLKIAFEESGLYLSKDDANILNTKQAIWVGGPKKSMNVKYPDRGYVMIVGTLRYKPISHGYGHLGLWLAELVDIEQIIKK